MNPSKMLKRSLHKQTGPRIWISHVVDMLVDNIFADLDFLSSSSHFSLRIYLFRRRFAPELMSIYYLEDFQELYSHVMHDPRVWDWILFWVLICKG